MIGGVVLAAGTSSRMGEKGPKQLLELDGRPLVQHVVDAAARGGLGEVVVVTGHGADEVEAALVLPEGVRIVRNPGFRTGQAGSLQAGLAALDPSSEAAIVLLADQPLVPIDAIRRVVEEFRRTGSGFVVPHYQGRPGHPVLIARTAWPLLRDIGVDVGARDVIRAHPELVSNLELGELRPVDVDTWDDYQRILGRS